MYSYVQLLKMSIFFFPLVFIILFTITFIICLCNIWASLCSFKTIEHRSSCPKVYTYLAKYLFLWYFLDNCLKIFFWLDIFQTCESSINKGVLLHQCYFTVLIRCFILFWLNVLYQPNSFSSRLCLASSDYTNPFFFWLLRSILLVSFHSCITV